MVAGLALTPVTPSGFGIIGHALGLRNRTLDELGDSAWITFRKIASSMKNLRLSI